MTRIITEPCRRTEEPNALLFRAHEASATALLVPIRIPPVGEVRGGFADATEPLALALAQEKEVTARIKDLFRAARAEEDALGEQFILWFLKEQVEEVASMTTLLNVARRAGDNLFDLENYVARETIGDHRRDPDAPRAAGGAL
ncbi:ferritin [Sinomonas sp. B1-1]|uniref:ferritin n=1 Tax=Sinomonas sp. B1-1 TaxID=3141454 RepID=UPI003D2C9CCF